MTSRLKIARYQSGEQRLVYRRFLPASQAPKGIVLVIHGMMEHSEYYTPLAERLTSAGFAVYAHDQRGHGKTAETTDRLGKVPKFGWDALVQDINALRRLAEKEIPEVPIILFGHSMGSFLAQCYASQSEGIRGLILSGTALKPTWLLTLSYVVATILTNLGGRDSRGALMHKLVFGGYNRAFEPTKTVFDWLSRDQLFVKIYHEDPFAGQIVTNGFFQNLFLGMLRMRDQIAEIPSETPLLFLTGREDPLSLGGVEVMALIERYKNLGFNHITAKFYDGGRHVMLGEINRKAVMDDVMAWLGSLKS